MYNQRIIQLLQTKEYDKLKRIYENRMTQLKWYEYYIYGYSYVRTNDSEKAISVLEQGIDKTDDDFQKSLLILCLMQATQKELDKNSNYVQDAVPHIKGMDRQHLIMAYSALVDAGTCNKMRTKQSNIDFALMFITKALPIMDIFLQQIVTNVVMETFKRLIEYYEESNQSIKKWPIDWCLDYYNRTVDELKREKKYTLLSKVQLEFRLNMLKRDYNLAVTDAQNLIRHNI